LSGAALLAAGPLQVARLSRRAGDRSAREPLVLILHLSDVFLRSGSC
jgi:uncharacterized protein involved in response to NO